MQIESDYFEITGRLAAIESDEEAIRHLKMAVKGGTNWFIALLEAIRLWRSSTEIYKGELYNYLIGGEAFDWLRLAERLCDEIKGSVPENDLINLLFFDRPPIKFNRGQFKQIVGSHKYRAYLNYLYGVLAEEALILATIYEVRKCSIVILRPDNEMDIAFRRIYGSGYLELYEKFRRENKYPRRKSMTLLQLKEFTYWLFKYRINHNEKTRVASDTKKALSLLNDGWLQRVI